MLQTEGSRSHVASLSPTAVQAAVATNLVCAHHVEGNAALRLAALTANHVTTQLSSEMCQGSTQHEQLSQEYNQRKPDGEFYGPTGSMTYLHCKTTDLVGWGGALPKQSDYIEEDNPRLMLGTVVKYLKNGRVCEFLFWQRLFAHEILDHS